MNWGLFDYLKSEFKNFTTVERQVERQVINTENFPDPNWISGFVTGEESFDVIIPRDSTSKLGHRVQLKFRISQHVRDIRLMQY